MKVRILAVLVVGALSAVKAPAAEPEKGKTDADRIQGTWSVESVEQRGKKEPEDKVRDAKVTFAADGKGTVQMGTKEKAFRYALDPTKKTREIDITGAEGGKEEVFKGIYMLDGDMLTICFAHPPEDRPTDFTTQEGSTRHIMVLKRDKK